MEIDLRSIEYYYLNTSSRPDRRDHIEKMLTTHKLIGHRIEGGPTEDLPGGEMKNPLILGAMGHIKAIEQAICRPGGFKPFVILEDDVSITSEPYTLKVPSITDVVYIGTSAVGVQPHVNVFCFDLKHTRLRAPYNHLFRTYNMLSTHAILFISLRYTMAYMRAMMEACMLNMYIKTSWDTISTRLSPFYYVCALEKPLFYQDESIGGQQNVTKINWTHNGDGSVIDTTQILDYHKFRIFSNTLSIYQNTTTHVVIGVTDNISAFIRSIGPNDRIIFYVSESMYSDVRAMIDTTEMNKIQIFISHSEERNDILKNAVICNPFMSRTFALYNIKDYELCRHLIQTSELVESETLVYGTLQDITRLLVSSEIDK